MTQQRGVAYIIALFLAATASLGLLLAAQTTQLSSRREKEAALLFAGDAFVGAIKSYHSISPGTQKSYPRSLSDLTRDRRFLKLRRHLRKVYRDPMTDNRQWGLVLSDDGGVMGVHSLSQQKPLKTANFPRPYRHFEQAKKYDDWRFVYEP